MYNESVRHTDKCYCTIFVPKYNITYVALGVKDIIISNKSENVTHIF